MDTGGGHAAALQHHDAIRPPHRGDALGHDDLGAAGAFLLQGGVEVGLGLQVKGMLNEETRAFTNSLLKTYGLSDFAKSYPRQLSGGMRQKVALIRTLACSPELLLLDEPFSALDYQTRLTVSDEIYGIIRKEGKTAILVTHDIAEAISMSDRILVFSSRPAKLRAVHRIELTVGNTPLSRRNSPEFKDYFDMIWKEIDHDEQ